jgi:hypothetical protein
LVVGAEVGEGGCGHVRLHRDRHRDRARAAARQLFHEEEAGREVAVASAEPGRVVEAEKAELTAAAEQRVGKAARPFPFVHIRAHLGVDEPANGRPQLLVFRREDGVGCVHTFYAATPRVDA